jgi:hypothetical protein
MKMKPPSSPTPRFEHFAPTLTGVIRSARRGLENSGDAQ